MNKNLINKNISLRGVPPKSGYLINKINKSSESNESKNINKKEARSIFLKN